MKFLLDVNALMAWAHPTAHGHDRFHAWARNEGFEQLATCAVAELGFLRVSMQVFGFSLGDAQRALDQMRASCGGHITCPPPQLPRWATTPGKTTDAYLAQVAASAGLKLATFDGAIPGAVRIG